MNNTLSNGFRLLDHLAETAEAMSVKELAEHFSLPNSHICRLLKTLTETGYVEQEIRTRKYRVSLKILTLAQARLQQERLLELARPYMQQLVEKLDATVFVTRVYCGQSLIIGTEYPALFPLVRETLVGTVHSTTSSACGQICAAYSSAEVQSALLDATDWTAPGDFQNRRQEFEDELEVIRRRGYALRDPSVRTGAVGVPLFEVDGKFNGALGVMLSSSRRRTAEDLQDIIQTTLNCGKLISFAQGSPSDGYPFYTNTAARRKK